MKQHRIRLVGARALGARVPASVLRDMLDTLIASTRHAVRLRVDGKGLSGPPPTWLERVSDIDVLPLESGSTVVVVEVPSLAEAAPERFSQLDFLLGLDPSATSIEVMQESLADALAENSASERFDAGLLKTFAGFGRLWRYGIDYLEMDGGRRTIRLDKVGTTKLETLERTIPSDQHVVIIGKLDQLHHSRRMFTLKIDDGKDVRGLIGEEASVEDLGLLFGRRAMVSGVARFRPSGEVLLIEAKRVEANDDASSIFSRAPIPLLPALDLRALTRPQGPRSGVSAIFGSWPGEETDDEVQLLLDELS